MPPYPFPAVKAAPGSPNRWHSVHMKKWIVRFGSLLVFNVAVLLVIGWLTPAKVGWSAIWAGVVLTATACSALNSVKDTFLGGSTPSGAESRLTGFIGGVAAAAVPGRDGMSKLAEILDDRGPGFIPPASELERRLFRVSELAGLPAPIRQFPHPGRQVQMGWVDAAWREATLIVEADGRRWHSRVQDLSRDHWRDAEAARAGWQTLRLLWEHLVDAEALASMKSSAYLVNTARGPIVDEAALVDALRTGVIAGAGLDVYEHEPEVHPGLLELDNVALVPHLGSATVETRSAMSELAARNVVEVLAGRAPVTPVDIRTA